MYNHHNPTMTLSDMSCKEQEITELALIVNSVWGRKLPM